MWDVDRYHSHGVMPHGYDAVSPGEPVVAVGTVAIEFEDAATNAAGGSTERNDCEVRIRINQWALT